MFRNTNSLDFMRRFTRHLRILFFNGFEPLPIFCLTQVSLDTIIAKSSYSSRQQQIVWLSSRLHVDTERQRRPQHFSTPAPCLTDVRLRPPRPSCSSRDAKLLAHQLFTEAPQLLGRHGVGSPWDGLRNLAVIQVQATNFYGAVSRWMV